MESNIKFESEFTVEELKRFLKIYNKLPNPTKHFNQYGLRYHIDILNKLGKKNIFFPLEYMALFVDVVTKTKTDADDRAFIAANFSGGQAVEFNRAEVFDNYHKINATSIGNMAYMLMNYKAENVKTICRMRLEIIHKIELARRN